MLGTVLHTNKLHAQCNFHQRSFIPILSSSLRRLMQKSRDPTKNQTASFEVCTSIVSASGYYYWVGVLLFNLFHDRANSRTTISFKMSFSTSLHNNSVKYDGHNEQTQFLTARSPCASRKNKNLFRKWNLHRDSKRWYCSTRHGVEAFGR